jgi:hypothetical protein
VLVGLLMHLLAHVMGGTFCTIAADCDDQQPRHAGLLCTLACLQWMLSAVSLS